MGRVCQQIPSVLQLPNLALKRRWCHWRVFAYIQIIRVVCVQVNYRFGEGVPYPASLSLAALRFLLPSPRLEAAATILGCSLPVSMNIPPYPALQVIFAIFLSVPGQAPVERGGALVRNGTGPLVEGLLAFLLPPLPSLLPSGCPSNSGLPLAPRSRFSFISTPILGLDLPLL